MKQSFKKSNDSKSNCFGNSKYPSKENNSRSMKLSIIGQYRPLGPILDITGRKHTLEKRRG